MLCRVAVDGETANGGLGGELRSVPQLLGDYKWAICPLILSATSNLPYFVLAFSGWPSKVSTWIGRPFHYIGFQAPKSRSAYVLFPLVVAILPYPTINVSFRRGRYWNKLETKVVPIYIISYIFQCSRQCRTQWPRGQSHELPSHAQTRIVGSNPTRSMDIWFCFVFLLSCVGSGHAASWSRDPQVV
jgi:hypothetical protein